jgi:hypothetical protein
VLTRYPRLTLAEEFGRQLSDQAARKPGTAARRLVDGGLLSKLARHPHEGRAAAR